LAEGVHALGYQSADNVENMEVLRSTTVLVDATAPVSTFSFGVPLFIAADGTRYVTPATQLAFSAGDPASNGVASGVERIEVSVDGAAFAAYAAALTFAEGRHTVLFRAIDRVGNVETVRRLDLQSDNTSPRTSLAVLGGRQFPGPDAASFYASLDTSLGLPAVDPVVNGVAAGLAFTRWQDTGGPFKTYASPFTLSEGVHPLAYQSADNVQNLEVPRSTTVLVDATPPVSALSIGAPQFPWPGVLLVSSRTPFSLSAVDPRVSGVVSGVRDIFWRVSDSLAPGAFSAYAAPFTLGGADALKTVDSYARDNVVNVEAVKSTTVLLDATPPELALLSPPACGGGICRVLSGGVPALGSVRDIHLRGWRLEAAPGRGAAAGFVAIASGTAQVSSGTLGRWDTTVMPGWRTLRLGAEDLVQYARRRGYRRGRENLRGRHAQRPRGRLLLYRRALGVLRPCR
ncbi:MAG: hypothetical protein FD126_3295, partial [Elusimicrobia bacterium]